jgi:hypothetical protein
LAGVLGGDHALSCDPRKPPPFTDADTLNSILHAAVIKTYLCVDKTLSALFKTVPSALKRFHYGQHHDAEQHQHRQLVNGEMKR